MSGVMFYTMADGARFAQAHNFLAGVRPFLPHDGRLGLIDLGLTPDQVAIAVGDGIAVESFPDDRPAGEGGAADRFYRKYRAAEAWPLVERFLYCDCDCVFTRNGLAQWCQRARFNDGLLVVNQPNSWFHLLRSHGIGDPLGLGGALYEPIVCASMFAATAGALKALDLLLREAREKAAAEGWTHWADEAGLMRVLHAAWRARPFSVVKLPPIWHWHAGLGWSAQRQYLPITDREAPTGPTEPATPFGDIVHCLHFGADGSEQHLAQCDAPLIPERYVTRKPDGLPI